ncbi:MAG: hypothetical protein AAF500_05970 [Myxococcota bacterium]
MSALLEEVRREIVGLHGFFLDWFHGSASREDLDTRFLSRLHPELVFVPPEGHVLLASALKGAFDTAHGTNPDFKIQIRDVAIRHVIDDHVLATYTEWQVGARTSPQTNNARFSTVLMKRGDPYQWLHIQETWLPKADQSAERFDF